MRLALGRRGPVRLIEPVAVTGPVHFNGKTVTLASSTFGLVTIPEVNCSVPDVVAGLLLLLLTLLLLTLLLLLLLLQAANRLLRGPR
jgi:hypothetical protein